MIKASELRLGNFVMDIVSGEWMTVDEIGENVGATIINRDKYPLPDGWQMGAIPITPEIWQKCGFKFDTEFDLWGKGSLWFEKAGDTYYLTHLNVLDGISYTMGQPILLLHKLQNLYFELTGEELDIIL